MGLVAGILELGPKIGVLRFHQQDVEITCFAEDASEPAKLLLDPFRPVAYQERPEQRERRAETPQSYPRLMKGFRISSLEKDFFVETELSKAGRGDLSKGGRRLDVSFEIEALCRRSVRRHTNSLGTRTPMSTYSEGVASKTGRGMSHRDLAS
jgi:hypothetical protein